jgi:hypothetical protein
MKNINLDLDEMLEGFTRDGMKRFVKKLLSASEEEEKRLLAKLREPEKNDLADLDEEMHGKPNTPDVAEEDMPPDGELPEPPKKKK